MRTALLIYFAFAALCTIVGYSHAREDASGKSAVEAYVGRNSKLIYRDSRFLIRYEAKGTVLLWDVDSNKVSRDLGPSSEAARKPDSPFLFPVTADRMATAVGSLSLVGGAQALSKSKDKKAATRNTLVAIAGSVCGYFLGRHLGSPDEPDSETLESRLADEKLWLAVERSVWLSAAESIWAHARDLPDSKDVLSQIALAGYGSDNPGHDAFEGLITAAKNAETIAASKKRELQLVSPEFEIGNHSTAADPAEDRPLVPEEAGTSKDPAIASPTARPAADPEVFTEGVSPAPSPGASPWIYILTILAGALFSAGIGFTIHARWRAEGESAALARQWFERIEQERSCDGLVWDHRLAETRVQVLVGVAVPSGTPRKSFRTKEFITAVTKSLQQSGWTKLGYKRKHVFSRPISEKGAS